MENVSKKTFRIASIAVAIVILLSAVVALIVVTHQGGESDAVNLVKSLNTTLDAKEETVSITNVLDALSVLEDAGVDVSTLTLSGDEMIVYNATTNRMVCYSGGFSKIEEGSVSKGDTLVVIDYTLKSASSATAQGITDYAVWADSSITLSSSASINIWLYQDGTDSVINTPNATIYAYGSATNVELEAVAADSYHLYGSADYIALGTGHIELTSSAKVGEILIKDVSGEETTTQKITVTKGAECDYIIDDSTTTNAVSYYYKESDTAAASASNLSSVCEQAGSVQTGVIEGISGYGTALYPYLATSTSDLTSIISATSNPIYVRLEANLTGANFVIGEGQNVTLDLNGYNITGGLGTEKELSNNVVFYNRGTLTINGSGTITCYGTGTDAAVYGETGSVTYLNGGTYVQGAWYLIHNYGTMTIDGATIQGSSYVSSVVHNGYYNSSDKANEASDRVTMTINSGTFTNSTTRSSTGSENSSSLIKNDCYGYLTINDGTFTDAPAYILLNWNKCTINGGEFTRTELTNQLIYNGKADDDVAVGQLAIYGGTFTYPKSTAVSILYNYNAATTSIYGGSFQVKPSETYIKASYGYVADGLYTYMAVEPARSTYEAYGIVGNSSTLKVTYYYQDADDCFADESIVYYGTLYLYGAFDGGKTVKVSCIYTITFVLMDESASLGDLTLIAYNAGYEPVSASTDINNAVSYIAEMTENSAYAYRVVDDTNILYADLASAISAASAGETIYINTDLDLTTYLSITNSITIDLKGHTVTSNSTYGTFYINTAGIQVTFIDSVGGGSIGNTSTSAKGIALTTYAYNSYVYVASSVSMNSNIYIAHPTASVYLDSINIFSDGYSVTTSLSGYTLNTKSVTLSNNSYAWYYASYTDTTSAQAYIIRNNTNIYMTLTNAVRANVTIYVNSDVTLTSYLSVYCTTTIDLKGHTVTSNSTYGTFYINTAGIQVTFIDSKGNGSIGNTSSSAKGIAFSSNAYNASVYVASSVSMNSNIYIAHPTASVYLASTNIFSDSYSVMTSLSGYTLNTKSVTISDNSYTWYYASYTDTTNAQTYIYENDTKVYMTLSHSLRADSTIYVNTDISLGGSYVSISASSSVTIDLQGHTITSTHSSYTILANTGCSLTIIDTSEGTKGTISNTSTNAIVIYVYGGVVVTIGSSITVTGNIKLASTTASTIYIASGVTANVITSSSGYSVGSETISDTESNYNGYTKYTLVEDTTAEETAEG